MIRAKTQDPLDWLIIDGAYVVWRSYHATPPLSNSKGFPTNAIHGFVGGIRNALKETRAKHCIVAMEGGTGGREDLLPNYKADRKAPPSDLELQFGMIWQISEALGWKTIQIPGLEADDVIYSLLKSHCPGSRAIFTTDKDIVSLVDDHTWVYAKEKGHGMYLNVEHYTEKWGVPPHKIPDILTLNGDTIDSIPGVKGIGKKSAVSLIQKYGGLPEMEKAWQDGSLDPKTKAKLDADKENYELSKKAVQLIEAVVTQPLFVEPDIEKAIGLFRELEMNKTIEKLEKEQFQTESPNPQYQQSLTLDC